MALTSANINASNSPVTPIKAASVDRKKNYTYARAGKRILDVGLVLLTLPFTLPVIGICALALWVEGGCLSIGRIG